jgi:hypothetical protein
VELLRSVVRRHQTRPVRVLGAAPRLGPVLVPAGSLSRSPAIHFTPGSPGAGPGSP